MTVEFVCGPLLVFGVGERIECFEVWDLFWACASVMILSHGVAKSLGVDEHFTCLDPP